MTLFYTGLFLHSVINNIDTPGQFKKLRHVPLTLKLLKMIYIHQLETATQLIYRKTTVRYSLSKWLWNFVI